MILGQLLTIIWIATYITTLAYQGLNAYMQYQTRKDLELFVADSVLIENGTRRMCLYMKRIEPAELPDTLVVESNVGEV